MIIRKISEHIMTYLLEMKLIKLECIEILVFVNVGNHYLVKNQLEGIKNDEKIASMWFVGTEIASLLISFSQILT